jgi:hypothetical protein
MVRKDYSLHVLRNIVSCDQNALGPHNGEGFESQWEDFVRYEVFTAVVII